MPTAKDEDWRKTEIETLDLSTFVAVGPIKVSEKADLKVADHALLAGSLNAVGNTAGIFVEDYQAQNLCVTIDPEVAQKRRALPLLARSAGEARSPSLKNIWSKKI